MTASPDQRHTGEKRPSVVFHRCASGTGPGGHDTQGKRAVAESLAALLGFDFASGFADLHPHQAAVLVVPSDTLQSLADAEQLGIRRPADVFGGVVPHPFVATKIITHGLIADAGEAPPGWSAPLGARLAPYVLPGHSAFTLADARSAGRLLLEGGAVRVKQAGGVGGSGQAVVADATALDACLGALDAVEFRRDGVVLERDLVADVTVFSVGQVQVGPWLASYCGTQHTTRNHDGADVYGGSSLTVARGDYDALLQWPIGEPARIAVEQALAYHRCAVEAFPAMLVTRCNYDVVQGVDERGVWRSGVLEQSWRIGGASGAEIAALHAFRDDAALQVVQASTHEVYGDGAPVPPGAQVHYDGVDSQVGRLTKYAQVQPYAGLRREH